MHGCDEDTPNPAAGAPANFKATTIPKWILDALYEIGIGDDVAAHLAPRLLNNLPHNALLTLADVACHRAQLYSSDARACAADLVKSIMEVLAAGDTESGDLRLELENAWRELGALGVPLGDEGRAFTLVDRIRWLSCNAEPKLRSDIQRLTSQHAAKQVELTDALDRAETKIADLEAKLRTALDDAAKAEAEVRELEAKIPDEEADARRDAAT